MVKKAVPSHRRRTYGRVCVVVASLVAGFSVWAAQPATAIRAAVDDSLPNTQTAASTLAKDSVRLMSTGDMTIDRDGDFTRVTGADLQLLIGPEAQVQFHSDTVSQESDGSRTLEGHVSITLNSTDAQPMIASAKKAVVTPESGGGFKVRLEHGSVIGPHETGREPR